MTALPSLPSPYRPTTGRGDAAAIHRLIAAVERDLVGRVETDSDHVATVLARPGLDPDRDTVAVHDAAGELAAWAWVDRRSEVYVHPGHRGRGVGTALLGWVEARAAQSGAGQVGQTVPDVDFAAGRLMRAAGYQPKVTLWLLGGATGGATVPVVDGVDIRDFGPGDAYPVYEVTQDAFDDWQARRQSYAEWAKHTVDRCSFAPWASAVARDGDRVVGAVVALDMPGRGEGYIEQLAVHRDHRRRGIARALLRHVLAAFARHGHDRCVVWTHSDTGARSLYERVGMTIQRTSTMYSKPLA